MLFRSILDTVGETPLISLERYATSVGACAHLFGKLESQNPGGSVKDRIARAMILDALENGEISMGGTIIEASSGNTAIGLAMVCAAIGLRLVITMPEGMSIERTKILQAYGAEVVLTPCELGMEGAIGRARELARQTPNSFLTSQFDNRVNPKTHFQTTGREIWRDLCGSVDIVVGGVGTGGTISGVGQYLKSKNEQIKIIAVEPFESQVLRGMPAKNHKIQGIGAGFIPSVFDSSVCDEIVAVKYDNALDAQKRLATRQGILVGLSSGAALYVATAMALMPENDKKNIIIILPDSGERYLSIL